MDYGLANGIYSNKLEGNATGLYDSIRTGLHNGIYNESLLPNNIVKSGLILYLDAKYPKSYPRTGNIWNDLSNSLNNGTLVNSPTFNSDAGGNISFNGVNNRVTIPINNITNWSIQLWVKSAPVSGNFKGIFEFALSSTSRSGLGINIDGKPLIAYSPFSFNVSTGSVIDNNQWYNITGTLNAGILASLYINSNLQTLGNILSSISATTLNTIILGDFTLLPLSSYPLNGNIAQVLFYNRVLSQSEINQNYQATKSRFNL